MLTLSDVFDTEQAVERRTNKALGVSPRTNWQDSSKPQRGDREFWIRIAPVAPPGLGRRLFRITWGCHPRLYSMAALRPNTLRSELRLCRGKALERTCSRITLRFFTSAERRDYSCPVTPPTGREKSLMRSCSWTGSQKLSRKLERDQDLMHGVCNNHNMRYWHQD